ncbi:MAG: flagellar biosynthesis protein FlhF [Pseudomonadota bacterium]
MKIKRYMAANMRLALRKVREEQGPDAVILSNQRVNGGVEVIAAVDYDESLVHQAMRSTASETRAPADDFAAAMTEAETPAADTAAPVADAAAGAAAAAEVADVGPAGDADTRIVWSQEPTLLGIQRQLDSMRGLLEDQVSRLAWNDRRRRAPQRAHLMEQLSRAGLDADIVRSLMDKVPEQLCARDLNREAVRLLVTGLPVLDEAQADAGGVMAVVGPTGVGKTTTIAKLAARFAMRHGADQIGLVTTDSYRIGAQEQLLSFGRIMRVPVHFANDGKELRGVLEALRDKPFVLIDTAGVAPRDLRFSEQLAQLRDSHPAMKLYLTLAANSQSEALADSVAAFAGTRPDGCIVTKIDEAASLGGVISTVLRESLPLAYVTDGQRVPKDFHVASAKRMELVKQAFALAPKSKRTVDEDYLAAQFSGVSEHAFA